MSESKSKVFVSSVQKELEPERLALFSLLTTDPFLKDYVEPVLFEKLPPPALSARPDRYHCGKMPFPAEERGNESNKPNLSTIYRRFGEIYRLGECRF